MGLQLSSLLRQPLLRLTPTSLATVLAMPASATLVMPATEDLAMLVTLPPMLPATPVSPPLPPGTLLDLPLLLSPLSEELTLVPDVTLPTLLESSMSPRGRLRLRLMLTMVPTVSATLVSATLVSDMLVSAMLPLQLLLSLPSLLWPLLPSPLSEELTLVPDVTSPTLLESSTSPRGRLMPSTVPTVLATLVSDTPVWDTAMPVLATLPLPLLLWPLSLLLLLLLLPATPTFPPLPLSPPLELPLLPSLLSEELMPELDVMSPTLLESSTLLRYCSKQLCFVRF